MKTCPSCGETYSERIDFCFADGSVLVLIPSAMDAPLPRQVPSFERVPVGDRSLMASAKTLVYADADEAPAEAAAPVGALEAPSLTENAEQQAEAKNDAPPPAVIPKAEPAPPATPANEVTFSAPAGVTSTPDAPPQEAAPAAAPDRALMAVAVTCVAVILLFSGWAYTRITSAPSTVVEAPTAVQAAPEDAVDLPSEAGDAEVASDDVPSAEAQALPDDLSGEDGGSDLTAAEDAPREASDDVPVEEPSASSEPEVAEEPPAPPRETPKRSVETRTESRRAPATPPPEAREAKREEATPRRRRARDAASLWNTSDAASKGTMMVTSSPSGATVYVDGIKRGTAPVSVKLDFGEHRVELTLEGYRDVSRTVEIRSDKVRLPLSLAPETPSN